MFCFNFLSNTEFEIIRKYTVCIHYTDTLYSEDEKITGVIYRVLYYYEEISLDIIRYY